MLSGPLPFTHTHCPALMLLSSLSCPAPSPCLRQAVLPVLLSLFSLSLDDVIGLLALPSCSQTVLAKTHLPEPPGSQTHVHIDTTEHLCFYIKYIQQGSNWSQ